MSIKKIAMVVNPHGGTKKGLQLLTKVQPIFEAADIELQIHETQHQGHAMEMARDLDFADLDGFCAIGGDGTLHESVNGMLARDEGDMLPIGMIPGGTGNAFMETVGLLDPIVAAETICAGGVRAIDVAKIEMNDETSYSCNIIGWGLVPDIGERSEKYRWTGTSRYTIASVIEVLIGRKRRARLLVDGEEFDELFSFILGCNTQHTGKGMRMAPKANLSDGLIDLIIVRRAPRLKLLTLLPKVFDGSHIESPLLEYRQVSSFELHPAADDPLNIDGELRGTGSLKVTMVPSAFSMFGAESA